MSMYELSEIKIPKIPNFWKKRIFWLFILVFVCSSFFGFLAGAVSGGLFYWQIKDYLSNLDFKLPEVVIDSNGEAVIPEYVPQTTQEEAIIAVVKEASPAVVSIVITKDIPVLEQYFVNPFPEIEGFQFQIPQYRQKGTQKQEIGGGSGFIVSEDGLVLTNKHVVLQEEADYTVFTNDGKSYSARVLARDPIQDLAVLKIEKSNEVNDNGQYELKPFPAVRLGDSDKLQTGQTVVAIGNALGEFRNTVSVGAVSGLSRKITASGGGYVETLEDVIQTDAAINKGNSGGPLLNLRGEVIGINTAMVEGAQSIGFTVPINKAKKAIQQVRASGKIVYPFLGVRYVLIDESLMNDNNLAVSYGALVGKGSNGEPAIHVGSPADKAGLIEGDILLEFQGKKITTENTLSSMIAGYNPGDAVTFKVMRNGSIKSFNVLLGERNS